MWPNFLVAIRFQSCNTLMKIEVESHSKSNSLNRTLPPAFYLVQISNKRVNPKECYTNQRYETNVFSWIMMNNMCFHAMNLMKYYNLCIRTIVFIGANRNWLLLFFFWKLLLCSICKMLTYLASIVYQIEDNDISIKIVSNTKNPHNFWNSHSCLVNWWVNCKNKPKKIIHVNYCHWWLCLHLLLLK